MARTGYVTVALPESLMDEVDTVVKTKKRGYTSRGEFLKEAARKLLDQTNKKS